MDLLRCEPGQFWQSDFDEIAYTVDVGNLFVAPGTACTYVVRSGSNLSASCLSGTTAISGSLVTTPCVRALSSGTDYTVVVKVTAGGETKSCFFKVTGRDISTGVDLT